jgi:putative flippase GtrA
MFQKLERLPAAQRQFVLFVLVGGTTTAFNLGIAGALALALDVKATVASTAGYWSGVGLGYYLNKRFTFEVAKGQHARYLLPYLGVYLVSFLLGLTFVAWQDSPDKLIKATVLVASVLISTICNFIGTKFLVFRK